LGEWTGPQVQTQCGAGAAQPPVAKHGAQDAEDDDDQDARAVPDLSGSHDSSDHAEQQEEKCLRFAEGYLARELNRHARVGQHQSVRGVNMGDGPRVVKDAGTRKHPPRGDLWQAWAEGLLLFGETL